MRLIDRLAPASTAQADRGLANLHYLNMYWLRDPVAESVAEWNELAERSFHWGRRDDVHIGAQGSQQENPRSLRGQPVQPRPAQEQPGGHMRQRIHAFN